MKLKSMRLSEKESKKNSEPVSSDSKKGPKYPYGLRIRLETDQIKKLGIENCSMDDEVGIQAAGKIISMSKNQYNDDPVSHSIEIQIEAMDISVDGEFEKGFSEASGKEK